MGLSFSGEIINTGPGGHAVIVPKEIAATFSSKRPPVSVVLEGVEFSSRLMVYGAKAYLGVRKDQLRAAGVAAGDTVTVELTEIAATEPEPAKEVGSPELAAALAGDASAAAAYAALPPDHRQEYARWVAGAADPDARSARIARTLIGLGRRRVGE